MVNVVGERELAQKSIYDCASLLIDALSKRRGLPPTGTATREASAEIDALVRAIKRRFKPDEGTIVAKSRLVKVLGVGNFGTIWEGEEVNTGHRVAVKIFRLERLAEGQMLFRFRKSIRAMRLLSERKRLEKVPEARGTIVQFGMADPTGLAFSMDLLPNGNLDDIAKRGWTVEHKLDVCGRVATAVAYSHAAGVIHRDIEPANVVLDDEGKAVLTDFDIADIKFATSMSTTVEGGLGTPVFAAPEQLVDAELADERSDVYSLGRLLQYMLLERSPGYQIEKDPALENLAAFPPALVEIVRKATQYDPARRFISVRDFQDALAKNRTGAAALRARITRLRRWSRHNWAIVTILGLLIAAITVAAVYQTRVADELADLAFRLRESIAEREAAVELVEKIRAELSHYERRQQSEARDRLIADAEARLSSAQQAVTDVTKEQSQLTKRLDKKAATAPFERQPTGVAPFSRSVADGALMGAASFAATCTIPGGPTVWG